MNHLFFFIILNPTGSAGHGKTHYLCSRETAIYETGVS